MALASATGLASFDAPASVKKVDFSEELAELIRPDNTILLSRIGVNGLVAHQLTHRWVESSLNPNTATLSGAIDDVVTSLTVATGEGVRFKVGTLFKFDELGKSEVLQVTDVSGDTLTVTRGYGSTTAESHADGAKILIISHNKQEGYQPNQDDDSTERTGYSNYLTTFALPITITRRRQLVDHVAVPDEFAFQSAYRLKEIERSMDNALINSVKSPTEGSDTVYSSFGGIIEFVSQTGGNVTTTVESLTPTVINAMAQQIWDDGGLVAGGRLGLIVGGALKRKISAFDQSYRRADFNSNTAGFVVEKFISDLGFEIEIIVDPHMPADVAILTDLNRIKMGPLAGDTIGLEELAKTGRLIEALVSGSYTVEVRNALEAHAFHNNLS